MNKTEIVLESFQGEAAKTASFTITNQTGEERSYMAIKDSPWVSVKPVKCALKAGEGKEIEVSFDTSKMDPGEHKAAISVEEPLTDANAETIKISVTIKPRVMILVNPAAISSKLTAGKSDKGAFKVSSAGADKVFYKISSDVTWVSFDTRGGVIFKGDIADVMFDISTEGLPPGEHKAAIKVESSEAANSPQTIDLALTVTDDGPKPKIEISADALEYEVKGKDPSLPQAFLISNEGGGKLNAKISANVPWLKISPDSGKAGKNEDIIISVFCVNEGLSAGDNKGVITVSGDNASNSPIEIAVSANYEEKPEKNTEDKEPEIRIDPAELTARAARGKDPMKGALYIENSGKVDLVYEIVTEDKWLSVKPSKKELKPGERSELEVIYKTSDLGVDAYSSEMDVKVKDSDTVYAIPVALTVDPQKSGVKKKETLSSEEANEWWQKSPWNKMPEKGETIYTRGTLPPRPLIPFIMTFGNKADKDISYMDFRDNKEITLSYGDWNKHMGSISFTDENGKFLYGVGDPILWEVTVNYALYSPWAERWGYALEKYYYAGSYYEGWTSEPLSGTDADEAVIIKKPEFNDKGKKVREQCHLIAVKGGAVVDIYGTINIEVCVKVMGKEIDLKELLEQALKQTSDKKWTSLYKPDKGDPRYDNLLPRLKPFVRNMGTLDPHFIDYRPLAGGNDVNKQISLGYTTFTLPNKAKEWRCEVNNLSFFYPDNNGKEQSENMVKYSLEGYKQGYYANLHETHPISKGDEGYLVILYNTDNNGEKYLSGYQYIIRVGTSVIKFAFSEGKGEPPAEIVDDLIALAGKMDYDELFNEAYAQITSGEISVQEDIPNEPDFSLDAEPFEITGPEDVSEEDTPQAINPQVGQNNQALNAANTPKTGDKSANGLVYSETFNDWVKPSVYDNEIKQKEAGRIWMGDKRGWETADETKDKDALNERYETGRKESDAAMSAALKTITDDISATKNKINEMESRREKTQALRDKLNQLEDERKQAEIDSRWNGSAVLSDTAYKVGREAFTGSNEDGETSYKAMALRMLMGAATGGTSEAVYQTADAGYRIHDNVLNGDSVTKAIIRTAGTMAVEEVIGRAQGAVISWGLNKGSSVAKKVLGGAANSSSENIDITPQIAKKEQAMKKALTLKNETQKVEAVKKLYQEGGMKDLSALERSGRINAVEAKEINKIITKEVNEAVDKGVKSTIQRFKKATGVDISEVMVGDSGSSAGKLFRSVNTDADRTTLVTFKKESLQKYADTNCGGDVSKAYDELSKSFAKDQDKQVNKFLMKKGLTAGDVDYKTYDRIGSSSGHADSYSDGFVRTQQAAKGTTTVYTGLGGNGQVKAYKTSGQAMTDREALNRLDISGDRALLTSGPKITASESNSIIGQQMKALSKPDISAEKASKALLRTDKAEALMNNKNIDPDLIEKARLIRERPQDVSKILGDTSEKEFVENIRKAVNSSGVRNGEK
ncbi:MAG: hypothetical protein HQL30_01865 [Candidatus Omnitrophica bacterium]|nr:hypothetical protein [Candidatus Omnitrophota bacterium]